ncbi:S1C family serine protease [Roseimaritima sediminicola]|uniref:S1C family serine protease n=1 Tax=Roseimaritima sediminicola TaxID=2662066 RepID=UPI0012983425|nr:trypsin-like peptidase domain-containing protein [Roseimaritima sediminicola]
MNAAATRRLLIANTLLILAVIVLGAGLLWQRGARPHGGQPTEDPLANGQTVRRPLQPAGTTSANPSSAGSRSAAPVESPTLDRLGDPQQIQQSRREIAEEEVATIALFKASAPSVVHITTHRVARDFFSLNLQKIPRGSGTGFVWDKEGHIVTNYHVIKDADIAYVSFGDQDDSAARLVGAAPEKDLAVLKIDIDPERLRPLPLGTSSDLEVGLKALAIGNPFGLDHTLTTGIVSALGREIESTTGLPIKDVIQTDAAINPGNSGGPLLDSSGRLIGVNTAIYSPSGTYAGIGFAIPVDAVKWVVPELIEHGKIIRAGLAATLASDRMIAQLDLPGVLILDIREDSQTAASSLRPTRRTRFGQIVLGDIIIAIEGHPVRDNKDLLLTLENYRVGETVDVTVWRDGQEVTVQVQLELAE